MPDCKHTEAAKVLAVCTHLWTAWSTDSVEGRDYFRCYAGCGLDRTLLCKDCGREGKEGLAPKARVCEECLRLVEEGGGCLGDWGVPGILVRDVGFDLVSTPLPPLPGGARAEVVAPAVLSPGHWFALTSDRYLLQLDLHVGNIRRVCEVADLASSNERKPLLHVAGRGDYAVIAGAGSETAVVVETRSGEVAMRLNRGSYCSDLTSFPAAFCDHAGQTSLVHATDWNRLDVSDVRTGRVLTPRESPHYASGAPLPPHYLDYFHGRLVVSPDGEWIADDGWVWHPCGVIRTWSLQRWLTANPWESEDGQSVRSSVQHEEWECFPLCWTSPREIAVWGLGAGWHSVLPAVVRMDVASGNTRAPIIGPFAPTETVISAAAALKNRERFKSGALAFDKLLYAWSPACGFSAWDFDDGARVYWNPNFCPLAYHPASRQFLAEDSPGNCRLVKLVSRCYDNTPKNPIKFAT